MRPTVRIAASVLILMLMSAPSGAVAAVQAAQCGPTWAKVTAVDFGNSTNQLLAAGAIAANDVWVGGLWNGDGSYGPLLEHWNGTSWTVATALGSGFIWGIDAAASNDVWAVGSTSVPAQHWDGASWSASPIELPSGARSGSLMSITALSSDDVWAVGSYVKGGTHTLTEHWGGSAWTRVPSPDSPSGGASYFRGVGARAPDDVWAVGYSSGGILGEQPFIEHWNGSAWAVVPSPTFPSGENDLFAVAPVAADDVWAVGMVGSPWDGVIEHWDGTSWSVARLVPDVLTSFSGVRAVSADDVWAVGNSSTGSLVEHWDGTAWARVATPRAAPAGQGLSAVDALANDDLWAVGDQSVGGVWETLVERLCPIKVTGAGFSPQASMAKLGLTTAWQVPSTEAGAHSVADASAMKLFDSGLRVPGGSFTYAFTAAGTYALREAGTLLAGTMKVPVQASGNAAVGVPFPVTWASAAPAAGFVFDVQVLSPGSSTWSQWKTGVTSLGTSYTAGSAGTYRFRARLRKVGIGASAYSPAKEVVVA